MEPETVPVDGSFEDKDLLGEDLLNMLERGSLHDVKIKLRDGEIDANKDVLIARSDYFATMLSNNRFIEGKTNSVDMSHCSKAIMERIIKYLFSGTVTFGDLSLALLLELTHVSEMILLSKLKDKLDDYITRGIIKGSGKIDKFLPELILGLSIADTYNLSSIRSSIMLEVYQNLKDIPNDVASSDSFKTLPFNVMREIVLDKAVFSSPSIRIDLPTKQRFEAFVVWFSENKVTQEDENEILASFDFEDFTVEDLMTAVRDSGLYSGTKIDKRVLELVKNQDNLLKVKDMKIQIQDLKIQKQDLKIQKQSDLIEAAKNYMNKTNLIRYRNCNRDTLKEIGLF